MGLPHERYLRPRFWAALILGVPVVVLAMGGMIVPAFFHRFDADLLAWVQLVLTTPVFFWASAPLNRRWWISLRERDTNMFTLIVTGTGAAYGYSVAAVLWGEHFPAALRGAHGVPLYFEVVAFITAIVLFATGNLRTRFVPPASPGSVGIETFALFLCAFLVVQIVSDHEVARTLALMRQPPDGPLTRQVAHEVCRRTDADAVLDGTVSLVGAKYVLGLDAFDCKTGSSLLRQQLKAARKVLIAENEISNCWHAGQGGYAFMFTVQSQDGKNPQVIVEDVIELA